MELIDSYYEDDASDQGDADEEDEFGFSRPHQVIDRKFQEQVWKWLSQHCDIKVGSNERFDKLRLSEVEAHNDNLPTQVALASAVSSSESTGSAEMMRDSNAVNPLLIRMYGSDKQVWLACAGHEPDPKRIPPLDFKCLSIIAAHKRKGILQPQLTRLTGQDKRSLPSRTQRLHDAGYIVKTSVVAERSRTSHLVLKKFATSAEDANYRNSLKPTGTEGQKDTNQDAKYETFQRKDALIRQAVAILKESSLMIWDDLKKDMASSGYATI